MINLQMQVLGCETSQEEPGRESTVKKEGHVGLSVEAVMSRTEGP